MQFINKIVYPFVHYFYSNQMSWIECVADKDYQIFSEEPYQIRRKTNKRIVKESIDESSGGYIRLNLNQKRYYKHVILAHQFLSNPDNLQFVDHINRIRTDNRIENLRWASRSDNNRNSTSHLNYTYNYVDNISDNSFEFHEYNDYRFENYWYDEDADKFYYFNGHQYRELKECYDSKGYFIININDINNIRRKIRINKFKKLYNI